MSGHRHPAGGGAAGEPGFHGGDIHALARALRLAPAELRDYSGACNVFAAPLTARLARVTPFSYDRYPDAACAALREVLAGHEDVGPERILAGNGATDLIWLAMRSLAPRRVLFLGPVFPEYVRACAALDVPYDIVTPPAEQDFVCGPAELRRIWDSGADLAVLCAPNNPAAAAYPNIQEMFGLLRVPRVIVDNTYREFLWGGPEYAMNGYRAYAAMARPGVAVFSLAGCGSFFACPGLRLGYLAGDPGHLRRMARIMPPWTVSGFAQDLGVAMLGHMEEYRHCLRPMRDAGLDAAREVRRLACFDPDRVFEGPGFITAGLVPGLSAALVRDRLLRQKCVTYACDGVPGMPPGYLRMEIKAPGDMEPLLEILRRHAERGW